MAAIRLHVKKEHLQSTEQPVIHSVPCKIHGNEEANVSKFFDPFIRKTGDKYLQTSFRGYPLEGTTVLVPQGYKGLTFFELKKPDTEDAQRSLHCTGVFTQFTYWNYDKIPSQNDSLAAALDWIDIAEVLHSTVTDDKPS